MRNGIVSFTGSRVLLEATQRKLDLIGSRNPGDSVTFSSPLMTRKIDISYYLVATSKITEEPTGQVNYLWVS